MEIDQDYLRTGTASHEHQLRFLVEVIVSWLLFFLLRSTCVMKSAYAIGSRGFCFSLLPTYAPSY